MFKFNINVFALSIFITLFFSSISILQAEDKKTNTNINIIPVGDATLEREKISIIPPFIDSSLSSKSNINANLSKLLDGFQSLFLNDFAFYQNKFLVPNYKELSLTGDKYNLPHLFYSPNYELWRQKKSDFLIHVKGVNAKNSLKIIILAYDVKKAKQIYQNTLFVTESNYRKEGHKVANDIYKLITGKESIFTSQIVFVSDRGSVYAKGEVTKELYIMDFDGHNTTKLTNHQGVVISPMISKDKNLILYSLIRNIKGKKKNVDLYLLDLKSQTTRPISTLEGINSGAVFLPDGENIALTLSQNGNADIFIMNINSKQLRQITKHPSEDVDPSISHDGKLMAFLSGRPGRAMIYVCDPSGIEKDVRRVSYVGEFHATPRFSPDGQEIVFSSWVDNNFDIFRIDTEGKVLHRLTKNFGSCEEPSFSSDNQFIVFSSKRSITRKTIVQDLYIMDRDGEIIGAITHNIGNCTSPRWSN
ncbi:MAG: PD40 domain-containing protein [Oligoflexia bacterium]|nr:PD40 domain-containing protein [Oligoflexia bacterium]